jgi:hypothetical protein
MIVGRMTAVLTCCRGAGETDHVVRFGLLHLTESQCVHITPLPLIIGTHKSFLCGRKYESFLDRRAYKYFFSRRKSSWDSIQRPALSSRTLVIALGGSLIGKTQCSWSLDIGVGIGIPFSSCAIFESMGFLACFRVVCAVFCVLVVFLCLDLGQIFLICISFSFLGHVECFDRSALLHSCFFVLL